jgi:hypothetical protein
VGRCLRIEVGGILRCWRDGGGRRHLLPGKCRKDKKKRHPRKLREWHFSSVQSTHATTDATISVVCALDAYGDNSDYLRDACANPVFRRNIANAIKPAGRNAQVAGSGAAVTAVTAVIVNAEPALFKIVGRPVAASRLI